MAAKRANALRVQAEAINWGERGARANAISPGVIATPLGPPCTGIRDRPHLPRHGRGIALQAHGPARGNRRGAAFLLGPTAGFITGSDLLIDGGVIAAMRAGKPPTPG
jgi:NAD(P)-dependent dehydrogenase (short-subunit alcohol dehydrogenase family)